MRDVSLFFHADDYFSRQQQQQQLATYRVRCVALACIAFAAAVAIDYFSLRDR